MANMSVAHEQLLEERLAVTRQAVLPGELRSDVKSGRRRSPRSCALCHATVPPPLQMCDGDAPLVRSHCLPPANVSGDQARSCAHGWGTWHRLTHTVAVLVPDLLRLCGLAAARGKKVSASHSVARPAPARRDAVNMPVVIDGACSSSSSTTPTRSCADDAEGSSACAERHRPLEPGNRLDRCTTGVQPATRRLFNLRRWRSSSRSGEGNAQARVDKRVATVPARTHWSQSSRLPGYEHGHPVCLSIAHRVASPGAYAAPFIGRSCSSRHARIVRPQRRVQSLRAFQPKVSTWFIPSLRDDSSYTIVSGCVRLYQPPTVAETTPLAEVSWRGGHTTALC
jgi:hypothetical protein